MELPQRVLMVSGDFVLTGGMDRANYAVADYLARNGVQVELVAHRIAPELAAYPNVLFHRVPKPLGSYFLGSRLIAREGQRKANEVRKQGGQVIVNGGNCVTEGVNWVHYVHAAYIPENASFSRRLKQVIERPLALRAERRGIAKARLVIANSDATRNVLINRLGVNPAMIKTIYYGIDEQRFCPSTDSERRELRKNLGWDDLPRVVFIGALGDRRKGFDIVAKAWSSLKATGQWDAKLVVIGSGAEQSKWQRQFDASTVKGSVEFLGFRRDVPDILRASDCLVAPTRYEAYGLGVHEALCCGLPAFVNASAGVAERYPQALSWMILNDPESADELVSRLQQWLSKIELYRNETSTFAASLRSRSWDAMSKELVEQCR